MASEVAWLQNVTYPARIDRYVFEAILGGRERIFDGLVVSERGAGANNSVDISIGGYAIKGDDQPFQGFYVGRFTAVENVVVGAAPGAGTRTDLVVAQVLDPNAGGGAGDTVQLQIVEGTTTAPASAIALAQINRYVGQPSILDSDITDVAPRGPFPYKVDTVGPSGSGVHGDLWVVV